MRYRFAVAVRVPSCPHVMTNKHADKLLGGACYPLDMLSSVLRMIIACDPKKIEPDLTIVACHIITMVWPHHHQNRGKRHNYTISRIRTCAMTGPARAMYNFAMMVSDGIIR